MKNAILVLSAKGQNRNINISHFGEWRGKKVWKHIWSNHRSGVHTLKLEPQKSPQSSTEPETPPTRECDPHQRLPLKRLTNKYCKRWKAETMLPSHWSMNEKADWRLTGLRRKYWWWRMIVLIQIMEKKLPPCCWWILRMGCERGGTCVNRCVHLCFQGKGMSATSTELKHQKKQLKIDEKPSSHDDRKTNQTVGK